MSWATLFDRASAFGVTCEAIHATEVGDRSREELPGPLEDAESVEEESDSEEPAVGVVADAGVLVADLFVDGPEREALDHVRRHSWVHLVASDDLLAEAHSLVAELSTTALADDWLEEVTKERVRVEHPAEDTPALASAYRGDARHLLTENEALVGANVNLSLQARATLSIRPPDSFANLFDPEPLYEDLFDEPYPGPDRDPRA